MPDPQLMGHKPTQLDPDWLSGYKRANVQACLAKCCVALSEIDYELIEWAKAVHPSNQNRSTSA